MKQKYAKPSKQHATSVKAKLMQQMCAAEIKVAIGGLFLPNLHNVMSPIINAEYGMQHEYGNFKLEKVDSTCIGT